MTSRELDKKLKDAIFDLETVAENCDSSCRDELSEIIEKLKQLHVWKCDIR